MLWHVIVAKSAFKSFKSMSKSDRKRIHLVLKEMQEDPFSGDVKVLIGIFKGSYRRRIGSWRIFYNIDTEIKVVAINDIKRRGSKTYS